MRKSAYRGKYPHRIKTYSYSPAHGHHIWLNDGTHYRITPTRECNSYPHPWNQDFDNLNGKAFTAERIYD